MPDIEEVVTAVEQYNPNADLDLIHRAYLFSAEAHKEQKRRSGIPYVSHPLAVAYILTQLRMDAMTIASALLHDTIEDTGATEEQITQDFGQEVAVLVNGVTKLNKLEFGNSEEHQAESFRKMVIAMAKDIRVILVKLADRLHNLRTLEHMPDHKRRPIAQETLDIYAPLANRLGISWMKAELEDLSFRYAHPLMYEELNQQLTSAQQTREQFIERAQSMIADTLSKIQIPCRITGREKNLYSIYQKMQRQQSAIDEIYDILYLSRNRRGQ